MNKLTGHDGLYRLWVGDHRVVYEVQGDVMVVLVVNVGNRRDVYRRY
ncbi:type II toxin-antitoxin system RelE/ParE family toxin [Kitasatospora sp. NPDC086009]